MAKESEERITELEIQLAHLQRLFEQLNDVVTDQARRVDKVVAVQKKLEEKLSQSQSSEADSTDPLDEKPPHY